jgi:hypothetical protein
VVAVSLVSDLRFVSPCAVRLSPFQIPVRPCSLSSIFLGFGVTSPSFEPYPGRVGTTDASRPAGPALSVLLPLAHSQPPPAPQTPLAFPNRSVTLHMQRLRFPLRPRPFSDAGLLVASFYQNFLTELGGGLLCSDG